MTEIRINTEQVSSTGQQFQTKAGELEQLIGTANRLMNELQGSFTGKRAQAIFADWNGMAPNLRNATQSLRDAGTLLSRAATDFSSADGAK